MSNDKIGADILPPTPVKLRMAGMEDGSTTSKASTTLSARKPYNEEEQSMLTITGTRMEVLDPLDPP